MTKLSNLNSLTKKRKRVGRGGSRGGTSGRGNKGQKARSGPSLGCVFEGGQMPLSRRLPKRGFSNAEFKKLFELINLDALEAAFEAGTEVTQELLLEKGVIKGKRGYSVKVLGNGTLTKKLIVHADAVSKTAEEAIKKQGGEVHINKER